MITQSVKASAVSREKIRRITSHSPFPVPTHSPLSLFKEDLKGPPIQWEFLSFSLIPGNDGPAAIDQREITRFTRCTTHHILEFGIYRFKR
jgi:hypothetical protein